MHDLEICDAAAMEAADEEKTMSGSENLRGLVQQSLSDVIDPETGLNVLRMEIIHELQVGEDGTVSLIFRPSSPVCPMAFSLANSIKRSIEALEGVSSVQISVENFNKAEQLESLINK